MSRTPHPTDLLAALQEFLAARFDIPAAHVQAETSLRELGLDSMMVMDVMMDVEDRLGVKLVDLALPRDPRVGDVIELIDRNLAGAG